MSPSESSLGQSQMAKSFSPNISPWFMYWVRCQHDNMLSSKYSPGGLSSTCHGRSNRNIISSEKNICRCSIKAQKSAVLALLGQLAGPHCLLSNNGCQGQRSPLPSPRACCWATRRILPKPNNVIPGAILSISH